jgi:hypothetical protein
MMAVFNGGAQIRFGEQSGGITGQRKNDPGTDTSLFYQQINALARYSL